MHFTESNVWKMSVTLGRRILELSELLPPSQKYGMAQQLSRAAISVSSNIAEGWSRESLRHELSFMDIANGSLYEIHSQLVFCREMDWLTKECTDDVLDEVLQLGSMLGALKKSIRQRIRLNAQG